MSLDPITALVSEDFEKLTAFISNNISSDVSLVADLSHHIIDNGGKRLRPLLLMLTAKACGYQGEQHILPAAAIEYFHTATLLHDDVLDESATRRGKHTANSIWGSKASILVGDILLTQSVQFMLDTDNLAMLKVLIKSAFDITCGEVKQLVNAHSTHLTQDDYFEVIKAKTALLFSAATEIGAMMNNMTPEVTAAMKCFGLHLGNAFQIVDDILDYTATVHTLGKHPGDDLRDGKMTLPLLYALEACSNAEYQLIQESLTTGSDKHLEEIIQLLYRSKAIERSYQTARAEIDHALSCLHQLPVVNVYKDALQELAIFAVERTH